MLTRVTRTTRPVHVRPVLPPRLGTSKAKVRTPPIVGLGLPPPVGVGRSIGVNAVPRGCRPVVGPTVTRPVLFTVRKDRQGTVPNLATASTSTLAGGTRITPPPVVVDLHGIPHRKAQQCRQKRGRQGEVRCEAGLARPLGTQRMVTPESGGIGLHLSHLDAQVGTHSSE